MSKPAHRVSIYGHYLITTAQTTVGTCSTAVENVFYEDVEIAVRRTYAANDAESKSFGPAYERDLFWPAVFITASNGVKKTLLSIVNKMLNKYCMKDV